MKKRFVFLANTRWRPRLSKFEVIKETPKLLKLGEATPILGGRIWGNQIHKENDRYFDDPIDAIEFLIVEQGQAIQQLETKLDDAHDDLGLLNNLLKEMRKNDGR